MTKLITILTITLSICALNTNAQDLVVKNDSSKVTAKIIEITPDNISYKKASNLNGPTYTFPIKDIHYIIYENGEKEVFTAAKAIAIAANIVSIPAVPIAKTAEISIKTTDPKKDYERGYSIGDIYYENDVPVGVVIILDDSKRHGVIVSFDEIYMPWSRFKKPDLQITKATDPADGEVNMRLIEKYINDNKLSWRDFPAFDWCRKKGEGWYLPSIRELVKLGDNYNGGKRDGINRNSRNNIDNIMKNNGGKGIHKTGYYHSSTEINGGSAYNSHVEIAPPHALSSLKSDEYLIRAMKKF